MTPESIVGPVKYVVGASFVRDGVHGLHVVHLALRNQQERGNLSFDIKKRMNFDAPFVERNFAHSKSSRQRSIVVESNA